MAVTSADILNLFARKGRKQLSEKEILGHFDLDRDDRFDLVKLLKALSKEGVLVRNKGGSYLLAPKADMVVGKISVHRDGFGFVVPEAGNSGDIFIPARFLDGVMNGDRVVAAIEGRGRRGNPEGRIVQVLERATQTLVGRYEHLDGYCFVVPSDLSMGQDILISPGASGPAQPGQIVVVRIDVYPQRNHGPLGTVIEVLGDPDDPMVEILVVAHRYGLPHKFSEEAQAEALAIAQEVRAEDLDGRVDLRALPTVTIDGETAKDFDDAVSIRLEDQGRMRLWVSIADVGHYVRPDSAIDRDAYERGTSVYFPGCCIPMLPEALSNGLCSLNPGVDRLTMTAEMVFDKRGERIESRFYPSVIHSHARMTYTKVKQILVDRDPDLLEQYASLVEDFERMAELSSRLTEMRRRRGSLDFDLPEAEIILDLQGKPEDIIRSERNLAHRLIEEFMLAANEAVAEFVHRHKAPFLYRIHEEPDMVKLQEFQQFIAHFNYGLNLDGPRLDPRILQDLLRQVEGAPEENMINKILLRCMKQACYSPENVGHFGLASELYCHFTSPIRRYPDLVVHRILRSLLCAKGLKDSARKHLVRELPETGKWTSRCERRAMEAEREIVDLKKCQFMVGRVGEEFDGIISTVQPFGMFVELENLFIEGLIHISSLGDDYYQYEEERHRLVGEHRRKMFQIGDRVRVRVEKVSPERREIDFVIPDMPAKQLSATRRPGGSSPPKRVVRAANPSKGRPEQKGSKHRRGRKG